MRERIRAAAFAWREAWALSPRAAVLSFLETAASAAQSFAPAVYGMIAAAITAGQGGRALLGGALVGVIFGSFMLFSLWGTRARVGMMQALADRFEGRTAQLLAQLPTISHHEDPETLETVQALRDRGGAIGAGYNALMNAVRSLIVPATTLAVAVSADWRLLLVAAAGVPQILLTGRISQISKEAEEAGAIGSRRSALLMDLAVDRSGASEVRAFGARGFLRRRIVEATTEWTDPEVASAGRIARLLLLTSLLYFMVAGAVIAWMGVGAIGGTVTIAAMTVAVTSLENLQSAASQIRMGLNGLDHSCRTVSRYLWLSDRLRAQTRAHGGTAPPPEHLREGIRLVDVTFARPGADRPVIEHLDLELPAGRTIALVGENGAGKSTLVDLLLGMHDLDDGRIEIDGIPLTSLDLVAWRDRCSGAFQDHARLEVTAQQAIGLGDLPQVEDPQTARQALEDAAATDIGAALPRGLATQLGTSWEEGVGLSGGQWQRLAIARGMMRRAPLLRVLDEPTSALDPATEDALFRRYAEAARATARTGGITLLVTHRFSTVSAADLVVVLDGGRVIEQGTPAELMRSGGRYRELYDLQARGYA